MLSSFVYNCIACPCDRVKNGFDNSFSRRDFDITLFVGRYIHVLMNIHKGDTLVVTKKMSGDESSQPEHRRLLNGWRLIMSVTKLQSGILYLGIRLLQLSKRIIREYFVEVGLNDTLRHVN